MIAGPVFKKVRPITWLRSDANKNALPLAIPVEIFKIVARKVDGQWDVLAFVYPQTHKSYAKGPYDPEVWLKPVADIEALTGEQFLSGVPNADTLKKKTATKIWPVAKMDFDDPGASRSAPILNNVCLVHSSRDAAEGRVELAADTVDCRDDGNCNAGNDQTVLDRSSAGFILAFGYLATDPGDAIEHVRSLVGSGDVYGSPGQRDVAPGSIGDDASLASKARK